MLSGLACNDKTSFFYWFFFKKRENSRVLKPDVLITGAQGQEGTKKIILSDKNKERKEMGRGMTIECSMSVNSIPSPYSAQNLNERQQLCSLSKQFRRLSLWHHHKCARRLCGPLHSEGLFLFWPESSESSPAHADLYVFLDFPFFFLLLLLRLLLSNSTLKGNEKLLCVENRVNPKLKRRSVDVFVVALCEEMHSPLTKANLTYNYVISQSFRVLFRTVIILFLYDDDQCQFLQQNLMRQLTAVHP